MEPSIGPLVVSCKSGLREIIVVHAELEFGAQALQAHCCILS